MDVRKRFLDAIAAPESGGRYNVRYTPKGGASFEGFDAHPRIFEPGPAGPSSAAGRYQITATTYDRLGGGKFGPTEQDDMAWRLANQDYTARTGRNLEQDLNTEGFSDRIRTSLAPTWLGLKDNPQKALAAWNDGLPSTGASAADKPVYSPDLWTQARLLGNKVLPDVIDAPTPMTADDVKTMQADMTQGAQYMKGAQGLLSMASLLQPKQEPEFEPPMLQPQIVRPQQYRPLKKMRGLL